MTWTLRHPTEDTERTFESRSEAEEQKAELEELLDAELELLPPENTEQNGKPDKTDVAPDPKGSEAAEVVSPQENEESTEEPAMASEYDLPDKPPVDTDPLTWMPEEFTDVIDDSVAINRKGFSVLKQHYDISVSSDCIVGPEETEYTFCRVKAVAESLEGVTSEAHGSAHVDRDDDPWLLLEMADTRAKKRALSDATGVGMVAVSELQNEVEQ